MTNLQILRPAQGTWWMEVLAHSYQYDFYHLPQYHALAEKRGEGGAHLFVYEEGEYVIALPLLFRPIEEVLCHTRSGRGYWDASCVYGYAGPVVSHLDIPAPVQRNFRSALKKVLRERHVVSVFSRLHPLVPKQEVLDGLGTRKSAGRTVSIDLTLPVAVQRARYRKNHKRDINRLRRLGVTCCHDPAGGYLDDFVALYYETMSRVSAADTYFFERSYFEELTSVLAAQMHLFVGLLEGTVICGGLFGLCNGIVQYHLGGTRDEFLDLSPLKLLLDEVRLWATACQAHVFHLGGGVGGGEDSLFHFKAGFSDRTHAFALWFWVVLPEVYDRLCKEKTRWSERYGLDPHTSQYFPNYRCPICPRGEIAHLGGTLGNTCHISEKSLSRS
jgi:hypothetical protein